MISSPAKTMEFSYRYVLWAKTPKAWYFPIDNFLEISSPAKSSATWNAFYKGQDLLLSGFEGK